MSESDKDIDVNPEAGIIIALEKIKKKGKGQYFENIVAECSREFGWDGPKVYTAIEKAKELQMIKCVTCNNKISSKKAEFSEKMYVFEIMWIKIPNTPWWTLKRVLPRL